jgi:XapX domain-containing protein
MSFLLIFVAGIVVGALYAAVKFKSPAPPFIALIGLLGIWGAQTALQAVFPS